ncbi:MAG: thermonuclease family protein [Marinosulfonomonas sp.]
MLRICSLFILLSVFAPTAQASDFSGKMRFSDADTVKVGSITVRLFGIDAPETDQSCKRANGKTWSCGKWATRNARKKFQGRIANCENLGNDRYGRTVARCFSDGQDIAEVLVRDGVAQAYVKYSLDYVSAEKEASIANIGIWAGTLEDPAEYRASRKAAPSVAPTECRIKGNISKNGHIYHVPGQKYYEQTGINASRGERWFCSEAEAIAAGWRRSRI